MAINEEVYGAPSTWQDSFYTGGSTAEWAVNLHGRKPKVPNWNITHPDWFYAASQLRSGVDDGKIIERQPIDNSIAAVGQGGSSAFRRFVVFARQQREGEEAGVIRAIGDAYTGRSYNDNNVVNMFWFEANNPTSYAVYGNGAFSTGVIPILGSVQSLDQRIWSPSGTNSQGTDKQNGNYYIAPFLSYGTRTFCLQIMVYVLNSVYNPDFEVGSAPPEGTWRTLDSWKNNYSDYPITMCYFRIRTLSAYNSNTGIMGYYAPNYSSTEYRKVCAGILDEIKFHFDDGTTLSNLTDYALFGDTSNSNLGIYLFTHHRNVYTWTNTLQHIVLMNEYAATSIKSNGNVMVPYIPYDDEVYEYIMRACACFGLPFTPAKSTGVDAGNCQFNEDFTDVDLCLPIIDDNGIAQGDYTRGTANLNNDYIDLADIRDKGYDPGSGTDRNTYSSQTYFNPVLNLTSMCKRYVLNDAAVEQLCRDLWKISDDLIHTDPNEDFKDYDQLMLDNFLVNSPIDVIVSLDKYPISDIPTGTTSEPIKYGKATGAALGKPLTVNTIFFNFSGVDIYPKFGRSFLDYSPYTTYELYIPFCGVIQIDAGDIMDHTLSVQMVMDLSTGAVTAYVMADNLCIETANGMAALNIPVSGIDSITLNAQINNALINAKSAQMQARSTGTLTGRIGGGLKSVKESLNPKTATMQKATDTWAANLADYELTHQQLNPHKIGSASAACSWSLELTCRLMIYYPEGDAIDSSGGVSPSSPKLADLTLYGHTTGFSCISSGAVSNYHGFTVGNIDTSSISGATEQERDMIKSLFARGVYLP